MKTLNFSEVQMVSGGLKEINEYFQAFAGALFMSAMVGEIIFMGYTGYHMAKSADLPGYVGVIAGELVIPSAIAISNQIKHHQA